MSEYDHSHFLQPLTTDEVLVSLTVQQQRELYGFYSKHRRPTPEAPLRHNDVRRRFPEVTYYRTSHNTFLALRHTEAAVTHPLAEDIYLDTCAKDDQHMRQETYTITDLSHSIPRDLPRMDRIIYAEGDETKKRIVIELARRATWIELNAQGSPVEYPLQPFRPALYPPLS